MSEFDNKENQTPETPNDENKSAAPENKTEPNQGYQNNNRYGAGQYSQNDGFNQPGGQNNSGYYGNNGYHGKQNYVYYGNQQPYGQQPYGNRAPYGQQQPYGGANGQYNPNNPYNPEPTVKKQSHNKKKGIKIFASCVAVLVVISIVLVALSANGVIGSKSSSSEKIDGPSLSVNDSSSAANVSETGTLTAAGVYQKVKESSVGVLVYSSSSSTAASEGSGVIVGEDDAGKYTYIITCAHVVSGGGSIVIQLFDETQYDGTLIGYDSKTDIAVLRITMSGLTAMEIGDSEKLVVGETVYAIGNPGGVDFAGSFTDGMVSAIARPINSEIGYEMNCIQHTAAINPGNSGGALVNSNGQLVGINSSKIASTDYEGMGFAVPSSTFVEVYNEIIKNGYVTNRPKLGITYTPASASQTYSMLVSVKGLPAGSLIIKSIDTDSSLANTQVKTGDLITAVSGQNLDSADTLPSLIENSKVGDTLTLSICRFDSNYQSTEFDVTITLVEDKGTSTKVTEETTTQQYNYYNPFGSYGYGN